VCCLDRCQKSIYRIGGISLRTANISYSLAVCREQFKLTNDVYVSAEFIYFLKVRLSTTTFSFHSLSLESYLTKFLAMILVEKLSKERE